MFSISNTVVGALNVVFLLLGMAALGGCVYIHFHGANATDCQKVLEYPLLIGGVFVVVVSTLGIVGSFYRVNLALYIYLFVTFLLIVGLIVFTIFVIFVTNKKVGQQISGKGFKEVRVTDFSHWLKRYVINDKNWDEIKSCLIDSRVCQNLAIHGGRNNESIISKQMSTTQSGCCRPPLYCGFITKNATFWEVPKTGPVVQDPDCTTWNNDPNILCYDCNSCKAGVLANIRNQWRHLSVFNVCLLVIVIAIHVLGCCAIRNNRSDHSKYKHKIYKANP